MYITEMIRSFTLIIVSTICAVSGECSIGWHHYDESCYLFSHESLNWFNAQNSCRGHDARLAEVTSSKQAEYLRVMTELYGKSTGFWIGGRDDVTEGQWRWSSTGSLFTYTDWAPLEPSDGPGGNCMYLWQNRNWQWDDTNCKIEMRYVCESRLPDTDSIIG